MYPGRGLERSGKQNIERKSVRLRASMSDLGTPALSGDFRCGTEQDRRGSRPTTRSHCLACLTGRLHLAAL